MKVYVQIICVVSIFHLMGLISPVFAENKEALKITKINYQPHELTELDEIPLYAVAGATNDTQFQNKVDELIRLLEAHKKAAEQGQHIDLLQEKVIEINKLLEDRKNEPAKMTINEFHCSVCFNCHDIHDLSPSDKTPKQWRRLIEDDGHAIFENISWDTPLQKNQILEFLIENAGAYRAEGIGLWE